MKTRIFAVLALAGAVVTAAAPAGSRLRPDGAPPQPDDER